MNYRIFGDGKSASSFKFNLLENLTALVKYCMPLSYKEKPKTIRKNHMAVAKAHPLKPFLDQYRRLSGQKQRVASARSFSWGTDDFVWG